MKSYIIWMTQRNGSTLLCKALETLGFAGKPREWFLDYYDNPDLFKIYNCKTLDELQKKIWKKGSSENNIFGIKIGKVEPEFSIIINQIKNKISSIKTLNDIDVLNYLVPNCKHIFMTRRNKVRLAVSWWKAIQSDEWHRINGAKKKIINIKDKYDFDAIKHLYIESSMREAGMQEFFTESNIIPMTIVYEDFIRDYKNTIKNILTFLAIDFKADLIIQKPYYEKLSDDLSEEWCNRFVEELQKDWKHKGWIIK